MDMKSKIPDLKILAVVVTVTLCLGLPLVIAYGSDTSKAQAKTLLLEGNKLEQEGKLLDAQKKFQESQEALESKDATRALSRVRVAIDKRVNDLISESTKSYNAADYHNAIAKLDDAAVLRPKDSRINYNLALAYFKSGDRKRTIELLDQVRDQLDGTPYAVKVRELRDMVDTGDPGVTFDPKAKLVAGDINASLQPSAIPNENITNFAKKELEDSARRCKLLADNESVLPKTAPVLFNLAKCAEDSGQFESAARYFDLYLKGACPSNS